MPIKRNDRIGKYSISASPLYGIKSKRRLAEVLHWAGPPSGLVSFAQQPGNYRCYIDRHKPGKQRLIEAPQPRLKSFQKRVEELLKRIQVPKYLHSGIPGRSYLTCSSAHSESDGCTVTMDISDFYGSITRDRVARMFIVDFNCARDIAELLASLVCCNGHLATGCPASPLLSFFANKEMFDRIDARTAAGGSVLTLYIDDIALTGAGIGTSEVKWITRLLRSIGYEVKRTKTKIFRAGRAKLITGRVLHQGESRAPNSQHLKMKLALDVSRAAPNDLLLKASAVGRVRHVALLDDARRIPMRAKAKELAS
jgi:RNA-directed DNA polymerase